ncbi:MAG: glycerophosphodiester phosphodiesterase [Rhodospirillaceae bacterium]|nr:glycerophosphodiester phosphodiesterase [Rhodospirillaceae bacterium]
MAFDLQGHRGARGLMPENTLPAFAKALSLGVSTLELDTGVAADGVVVVSHDRTLNPALTRDRAGAWLPGRGPALNSLSFRELRGYDVGRMKPDSRYARRWSEQIAIDGTKIPSLADVFALARRAGNDLVRFNIETKIDPRKPSESPDPESFARALLNVVWEVNAADRVTIQSFDWRTLQAVQRLAPSVPTVYLTVQQYWLDNIRKGAYGPSPWTAGFDIEDHGGSVPRLVKAAGGAVWSPYHKEVDAVQLREARSLGLKVVVWTVNDSARMETLIDLGVDGIITDYPDRLRTVMARRGMALPRQTPIKP